MPSPTNSTTSQLPSFQATTGSMQRSSESTITENFLFVASQQQSSEILGNKSTEAALAPSSLFPAEQQPSTQPKRIIHSQQHNETELIQRSNAFLLIPGAPFQEE